MSLDGFTDKQKEIINEFSENSKGKDPLDVYEQALIYIPQLKKEGIDEKRALEIISGLMAKGEISGEMRSMVETIMGFMSEE